MNKEYFKIQYRGNLCESWFDLRTPILLAASIGVKNLNKEQKLNHYKNYVERLKNEGRFEHLRIVKVSEEVLYEV